MRETAINLQAALNSIYKLRSERVYPQTLQYWHDLLSSARHEIMHSEDRDAFGAEKLADQLERVLNVRFQETRNQL